MGGPLSLPLSLSFFLSLSHTSHIHTQTHSQALNAVTLKRTRTPTRPHTPQFQTSVVTFQFFAQSLFLFLKSFYDQAGHSRDLLSYDSPPKYRWGLYYKLIHSETCPGTKLEQQKVITDFMFYQHQFIKLHYYK